jgi:hypothetical protein
MRAEIKANYLLRNSGDRRLAGAVQAMGRWDQMIAAEPADLPRCV